MPKITYVGPHLAVSLPWPDGGEALVKRGQTVETTTEHAERLLEQTSNWQSPRTSAADKADKAEKGEVE